MGSGVWLRDTPGIEPATFMLPVDEEGFVLLWPVAPSEFDTADVESHGIKHLNIIHPPNNPSTLLTVQPHHLSTQPYVYHPPN